MNITRQIWPDLSGFLAHSQPDHPVLFAAPEAVQSRAQRFISGFDGLVTYAVKANPSPLVLSNLVAAGVRAFDVASPDEMVLVRDLMPDAVLHYNNPVRGRREIAEGVRLGVASWSVDSRSELEKLAGRVPAGAEIAVRFKLPVQGAAYDFGAKFGATEADAITLLQEVAALGMTPALTFHPGTQCTDPVAWRSYIAAAARIAEGAGVRIARLNVGGGFPAGRTGNEPPLELFFAMIHEATAHAFGAGRPALVCEPGRGMVGDAFALAVRVKAIRDDAHVFLNDGIYGALAEFPLIGLPAAPRALSPAGTPRTGRAVSRTVFGPTCDSLDRLPGTVSLPADLQEDDYLVFPAMGAYSSATATRFNGYGALETVTVLTL
ncbi:ornithine decarboxylase [Rhodovulum imhoffii]|uniref:ornithine decarboxylase n=1 Tax=Rhodovulum imhoffii TaxID=365340 RepID=A0A2T5BW98_9RHOB|nr:type III PLP-dependent enzyme [Rhodovulum imhoffii]MBK5935121.1 ornithine decarboxylase [Rhodovulum imhoffii]PTN03914.1 ornithine decarboxylase [Rhodovulum imhoffii]